MSTDPAFDHVEMTERFFSVIKSLNEFDKAQIRPILNQLVGSKTDEETAHLGFYYRAAANAETLLALKNVKDVQAIAMIARSLFEIAADSRLLRTEPDGPRKLALYADLEKLRSARKIVKFKQEHPDAKVHVAIYQQFLDTETTRIEAECKALWAGLKLTDIRHWSAKRLDEIVTIIGKPYDQIYAVNYPQLSWYVHSGLTGVFSVAEETFHKFAGVAFTLVYECYMAILADIIKVMRIDKAIEKINEMMTLARMLPFTDGDVEARDLQRALLG